MPAEAQAAVKGRAGSWVAMHLPLLSSTNLLQPPNQAPWTPHLTCAQSPGAPWFMTPTPYTARPASASSSDQSSMVQWSAQAGPKHMLPTRACAGSLPSTSCSPPSRAIPGSFPTKLPVALLTLNKIEQNKLELEQNNFYNLYGTTKDPK